MYHFCLKRCSSEVKFYRNFGLLLCKFSYDWNEAKVITLVFFVFFSLFCPNGSSFTLGFVLCSAPEYVNTPTLVQNGSLAVFDCTNSFVLNGRMREYILRADSILMTRGVKTVHGVQRTSKDGGEICTAVYQLSCLTTCWCWLQNCLACENVYKVGMKFLRLTICWCLGEFMLCIVGKKLSTAKSGVYMLYLLFFFFFGGEGDYSVHCTDSEEFVQVWILRCWQ